MTGLTFLFQEVISEVDAFSHLAKEFIEPNSRFVLPQFKSELESYRDQPREDEYKWQIGSDFPLRTTVSKGEYEVGGGGEHHIFADIDACWSIQRIPQKKKSMPARQFKLTGIASTRVRLWCETGESEKKEIAMWRMEVGDSASPGCHFHVQVLGELSNFPFPKSLSVPRLPGLILTPPAVAEFVLAELFQERWPEHVGQDSPHLKRWAPIQEERFKRLLEWKLGLLKKNTGSPWTTIKRQKPDGTLFVG
jgi:hypothetical protein